MNQTYEKILSDLKTAMKAKDAPRLQVLRSLKSKILEKEISERRGGESKLSEEQIQQVLFKAAKQRKEAVEQFSQAGRDDLVRAESYELKVIESYMPKLLAEDEIRVLVAEAIASTGASASSDIGKVMGALMSKVRGKADGSLVNRIVQEQLGC